jgi:hypothetical protein
LRDRFPLHRAIELYPVAEGEYARTRATIELIYRSGTRGLGARLAALASLVKQTLAG